MARTPRTCLVIHRAARGPRPLGRANLFKFLMGHHYQERFNKLIVAPLRMQNEFVEMIEREAENALKGKPASIIAKMNGLDDAVICAALYRASQAGVKIHLIIRGICRVRPGIPGVSENIRVVSIVGRFLEHHRVFRFENNGSPEFYMGSADLMRRNLLRRVEVITRVYACDIIHSPLFCCLQQG